MSCKFQHAAAFAVAATIVFTIAGAAGSGAFAQDPEIKAQTSLANAAISTDGSSAVRFVSQEVVQKLPDAERPAGDRSEPVEIEAASLTELVDAMPADKDLSKDMQCLASAIYFEARGEPLIGQLAVGEVIINRAESDSFPSSYCGVVYQRSQFSFVHGGHMPAIKTGTSAWREAKAIARIAHEGLWDSPAKDALFFHASYVKPGWHRTQVARLDRHIFYR